MLLQSIVKRCEGPKARPTCLTVVVSPLRGCGPVPATRPMGQKYGQRMLDVDDVPTAIAPTGHVNRLSFEFRRVSTADQPLSVLAIKLDLRPEVCNVIEVPVAYADAGQAVLRRLRAEDSLFLIGPGAFGILLPRVSTHAAEVIKRRLEEQLRDAAGLVPRFNFSLQLINYPDQARSAHEILEAIRPWLGGQPIRLAS